MSHSWKGRTDEERRQIVEAVRRRSVEESRTVKSLLAEYGISEATYQNWKRALGISGNQPGFRPVEVTALVPRPVTPGAIGSVLTLVTKSGHRIDGLTVEQAAQLLRSLEC